jgi:ribonucleotide monophosphatase NagD (HAD superfamily)
MAHRILTLGEITDGFDVILSDVWGVLHNGVSAFPHAAVALHEARKAGKTVVLITNSPRPAPGVIAQLRVLGVPDEAYDRIITSGDVASDRGFPHNRRDARVKPEDDEGEV